jgi:hypothetical protein
MTCHWSPSSKMCRCPIIGIENGTGRKRLPLMSICLFPVYGHFTKSHVLAVPFTDLDTSHDSGFGGLASTVNAGR